MIPSSSFGEPPWFQALQPLQSGVGFFWQAERVHEQLNSLQETLDLLRAVQTELEHILLIRLSGQDDARGDVQSFCYLSDHTSPSSVHPTVTDFTRSDTFLQFTEAITTKRITLAYQELISLEAARVLSLALKNQLDSFSSIINENTPWEEKSVVVRLAQKLHKSRRNKRWRKRKRKQVAELLRKEFEDYDKADQDADEWRTREIAKDIASRKVESMKEVAKLKAKVDKKRLESELELVLVVEKLQELRSMRIQKLKKQGHFLPEEDDKFLERVRAAVEEEERQAAAAADTNAAKDAIATAEESRRATQYTIAGSASVKNDNGEDASNQSHFMENEKNSSMDGSIEPEQLKVEGQGFSVGYDSLTNLPYEFYHYYHGSSNDMGTLIEVRRSWDAYIRPRGSRIPGHWVQPSPPADEVWASYLVAPK